MKSRIIASSYEERMDLELYFFFCMQKTAYEMRFIDWSSDVCSSDLALDQVAYREVAAAVDATGRFAENFTNRGIRSYLWGPLLLFGDEADRRATAERLKTMHGQVKGRGKGEFADERYSALKPAVWKWVGTSSMLVFYTGYVTTYGREFTDEQREVVYQTVLSLKIGRAHV